MVAVSELNIPIGEDASAAKYTDAEIDKVFELREAGMPFGMISKILDMPKSTVWAICKGLMRAKTPYRWREQNASKK